EGDEGQVKATGRTPEEPTVWVQSTVDEVTGVDDSVQSARPEHCPSTPAGAGDGLVNELPAGIRHPAGGEPALDVAGHYPVSDSRESRLKETPLISPESNE